MLQALKINRQDVWPAFENWYRGLGHLGAVVLTAAVVNQIVCKIFSVNNSSSKWAKRAAGAVATLAGLTVNYYVGTQWLKLNPFVKRQMVQFIAPSFAIVGIIGIEGTFFGCIGTKGVMWLGAAAALGGGVFEKE